MTSETRQSDYDMVGSQYDCDTNAFNTEVAYPRLIETLRHDLRTLVGKSILDVGCGSGRLVRMLKDEGAHGEGIDLSSRQVETGKERGLNLVEGSMLELPYPDEMFDATVSYHSFNYLRRHEQRRALAEQYRVLKSGGTLVLAAFYVEHETKEPLCIADGPVSHTLYLRTSSEIESLLQEAHFVCTHREEPVATPEQRLLIPEEKRVLVTGRPYMQLIVATRI